jgi:hypothetical protein
MSFNAGGGSLVFHGRDWRLASSLEMAVRKALSW